MNTEDFKAFIKAQIEAMPAEAYVLNRVVEALKDNGTPVVAVWDGAEMVAVDGIKSIREQVFNLDESWLYTEGESWVRLTMGNEWDTLTDYTTDLEDALTPATEKIEKRQAKAEGW